MKLKSLICGVAVAVAATTLKADTLYWQVAANSMGDFTYATLYATDEYGKTPGTAITSVFANGVTVENYTSQTGTEVSPVLTDLGSYGSSSYYFYVEVANYAGGAWETQSLNAQYPWSYNDLVSKGYISTGSGIGTPSALAAGLALNGGAVPEPTSGMLLLIGGSLLALRRRRR